ncbi:MAG: BamA/TamA family outer membrane protein, partial [Verrucomicrobiota bacterium]|nr:BamA/TamA family outer membrane protein [Verrucomicrobiota bacterium]
AAEESPLEEFAPEEEIAVEEPAAGDLPAEEEIADEESAAGAPPAEEEIAAEESVLLSQMTDECQTETATEESEYYAAAEPTLDEQMTDQCQAEVEITDVESIEEISPLTAESEKPVTPEPAVEVAIQQIVVSTEGDIVLDANLQQKLDLFIGSPLTQETVDGLKRTITHYYKETRSSLVAVIVPDQEVGNGVLQLSVINPIIGKIEYTGQQWTKISALEKCIGAHCGEPLDQDLLLNGVAWMNNNPFHESEIVLAPGSQEGTTIVQVKTKEKYPVRIYGGADNTGINACNQVRLYAGLAWGNAFGIGDLMTYQYTASPDFRQFQSHLVQYTSFLSWHHFLVVYGAYSTIFPEIVGFSSSGKSGQLSMRYIIPIKPFYTTFKQQITCGLDGKYLNNNLFYVADASNTPITQQSINITQLYLSYQWQQRFSINTFTAKMDFFLSPVTNLLANQTDEDYNNLRYHSRVQYLYARMAFRHGIDLPAGCAFVWLARGQVANSTLPVSEQFSLGGYDTVRGYQERPFLGDNAFCANMEFHSPRVYGFLFLAFWDYGWGYNYNVQAANQKVQWLMGTGPGIRYDYYPYISIRADYAFQLHDIPNDTHFGRFHLGITASY